MIFGAYLVVTGLWYVFTNKYSFNAMGWVMWSIPRIIGLALLYWGWSGISAPSPMQQAAMMMGGRKCWWK